MCSCSGSCNCNSTTIPKGPAGPIGPQGIQGPAGKSGINGLPGNNGKNSFTTLINPFNQPQNVDGLANSFVTIDVVDSTWAAINQVIYISYDANNIGGYYRVVSKPTSVTLYITRLSWVIPGVVFVFPNATVSNNSSVVPAGTKGVDGTNGVPGANGRTGINAFSPLTTFFVQPDINTNVTINTPNTAWIGIGQILYISSDGSIGGIGGFYQLVSKTATQIVVTRLDWIIPNITFIPALGQVPVNSYIIPSGSKGADGSSNTLSYIIDAFWGISSGSISGGIENIFRIAIPSNTLTVDDDVLECETIYKTGEILSDNGDSYFINITNENNSNVTGVTVAEASYYDEATLPSIYTHINCKIQRKSLTTFRCKAEIFFSNENPDSGSLVTTQVAATFMCESTADMSLSGGTNWGQPQYIFAGANDYYGVISVIHHQVKVVKKKV